MLKKLILFLFVSLLSRGQPSHEVGLVAGSANHIGDVGSVAFFNVKSPSFGVIYRLNKNRRISYRGGFSYLNIYGNDSESSMGGRKQRGYTFRNKVLETHLGIEVNFKNYSLYNENDYTPYIFVGLAYDFFDSFHYENAKTVRDATTSTLALPLALGIKTIVLNPIMVSAEVGVRYLFSDNLDGNNPSESLKKYRFGDTNSNDVYVFLGVILSLRVSKRPCFSCD